MVGQAVAGAGGKAIPGAGLVKQRDQAQRGLSVWIRPMSTDPEPERTGKAEWRDVALFALLVAIIAVSLLLALK